MSQPPPGGQPPPGWYLDPQDNTRNRWWDGVQWGPDTLAISRTSQADHRLEAYSPGGAPPGTGGVRVGWALGLGIAGLVLACAPVLGVVLAAVGLLLAILGLTSGTRGPKVVWATALSGMGLLIGVVATSAFALSGDDLLEAPPTAVVDSPSAPEAREPSPEPTEPTEPTDAPVPEPSPAEEQPPAAGLGEPVRDGQFEFTVSQIETNVAHVGNEYFGKTAQGQFVLVHVKIENVGDQAQTFSGSYVTAFDAQGREFSSDTEAAIYLEESNSFINEINPGNAADGIVVFDIPKDATITLLELHDSFFSGGATVRLS